MPNGFFGVKKINKKHKLLYFVVIFIEVLLLAAAFLHGHNFAVLNPQGLIAGKQRNLMIFTVLLSLVVVIPVFVMTFAFAWKYRETNTSAKYTPDWDHNAVAETVWWVVPLALIIVLSVVTWNSSHALDPARPINSATKPITIQVVAMDWKWLFIYPEQNIATVNFVQFPEKTPINFEITSDAPMNSFWIPSLGGQMYAMSGMSTQLHLMADNPGIYNGSSANISGRGFAGMKFAVRSSTQADFDTWVQTVRQSPYDLSSEEYSKLAQPSENNPTTYYSSKEADLYNKIIIKYMPFGHIHTVGE